MTIVTNAATIQSIELYMLFCMLNFLVVVGVWGTPVVYRGGWPVDCASCLYALIPNPR